MRWGLYKSEWGFDIRDKVGRRELRKKKRSCVVVYVQAAGRLCDTGRDFGNNWHAADMTPSTNQAQKRKGPPEFCHLPAERGKNHGFLV